MDSFEYIAICRLCEAIIYRAIMDLHSSNLYYKETAELFLKSDYCQLMCEVLGIDYERMLKNAKSLRGGRFYVKKSKKKRLAG